MTDIIEEFKNKTHQVTETLNHELSGIRTSRPTPALVEDLKVEYYGQKMTIKQVGSISVEPPRTIVIQVWDKQAVAGVTKAIEASTMGLSASADGNVIKIHLPELSAERREEIIKHVKKIIENYRIQIRHLRDEANKEIQKMVDESDIAEDRKFKLKELIQKETDSVNDKIEEALKRKIDEINS